MLNEPGRASGDRLIQCGMLTRPGPHQPLSQSLSAREAAERAAVICATAAEACARAERIVAESKAARETRRSSRLGLLAPFSALR